MSDFILAIPYEKKDELKKKYGLLWNKNFKMWYAPNEERYNGLVKYHVVKLVVVYEKHIEFKALGGQWNGTYNYVNKGLYNKHREEFDSFANKSSEIYEYSDEDS